MNLYLLLYHLSILNFVLLTYDSDLEGEKLSGQSTLVDTGSGHRRRSHQMTSPHKSKVSLMLGFTCLMEEYHLDKELLWEIAALSNQGGGE